MVRRYGRCCMYGPNYVKLSRVFAVQLFSMFIGHYAGRATPGPIRPPLAPQPCHHRLHSPSPHPCTATPAARDSNLGSGNHDMSRLSALAYPNDAPIHGLTDISRGGHGVLPTKPQAHKVPQTQKPKSGSALPPTAAGMGLAKVAARSCQRDFMIPVALPTSCPPPCALLAACCGCVNFW
jgi:hypothetical protein